MTEVYRDSVVSCQPFLSNADLNGPPVGPFLFLGGRAEISCPEPKPEASAKWFPV